jgi:hypothetical protein
VQALPNFFIAGAPKAGTTSLYHYLDQHPEIYMSPVKEPCHFASELRPENFEDEEQPRIRREMQALDDYLRGPMTGKLFGGLVADWDDYLKLFRNVAGQKAIGEASVCYLWSESAPENIHSRIPHAKIVMILRDPAERAFSQYLHGVSLGLIRRTFREQVEAALTGGARKLGGTYPFLEFGSYFGQVTRYLRRFPRENVATYLYDDFRKAPLTVVGEILRVLDVDANLLPDVTKKHLEPSVPRLPAVSSLLKKSRLWGLARNLTPGFARSPLKKIVFRSRGSLTMEPADRARLVAYYREDILKLADLLGRDLSVWLKGAGE